MVSMKRSGEHPEGATHELSHVSERPVAPESRPNETAKQAVGAALDLDHLEIGVGSDVNTASRPERVALFEDFKTQLPHLDSEERDAGLRELVKKLSSADIDVISKRTEVPPSETPETQFQAEKSARLGALPEMLTTERTHYQSLKAFNELMSDPSLQSALSLSDKAWLEKALPSLRKSLAVSEQMLSTFQMATGTTPDSDVKEAFRQMSPEQKRAASENILRSFNSPTFKEKFLDATSDMNKDFNGWDDFARRNQALLEKTATEKGLSEQVSPLGFNPVMPMVQRGPRYELLLKEMGKALPESFQPLAQAAVLRAKNVAMQINENRRAAEEAQKLAPQGALDRLWTWFGWK